MKSLYKLPFWLVTLVLLAGFCLVGCDDDESEIQSQQNNGPGRVATAPVTFAFSQAVTPKIVPIPSNISRVTISGSDQNNIQVQTGNPTFPVTVEYANPLGPVDIPVNVRHLQLVFIDSSGTPVGTGEADVNLTEDVPQTVNIDFDDGTPDNPPSGNNAKLQGTYYLELQAAGSENREIRGSVNFNGSGGVSGSLETFTPADNSATTATITAASSNYAVDDTNMVSLHIVTNQGTIDSTSAALVNNNGSGTFVAGTADLGGGLQGSFSMVKQASGTTNASLSGDYTVGGNVGGNITVNGTPTPVRAGFFGDIVLNGSGGVTGGQVTSFGLALPPGPVQNGSYSVSSNGRFTITYTTNLGTVIASGAIGTDGTILFSVNPGAHVILSGEGFLPSNSFTTTDFNGGYAVSGLLMTPAPAGTVRGLLYGNGNGSVTSGSLTFRDGTARAVSAGSTYQNTNNTFGLGVALNNDDDFIIDSPNGTLLSRANSSETVVAGIGDSTANGRGFINLIKVPVNPAQ